MAASASCAQTLATKAAEPFLVCPIYVCGALQCCRACRSSSPTGRLQKHIRVTFVSGALRPRVGGRKPDCRRAAASAGLRFRTCVAPCNQAAMRAQPAHARPCACGDRRCFLSFPTGPKSVGGKVTFNSDSKDVDSGGSPLQESFWTPQHARSHAAHASCVTRSRTLHPHSVTPAQTAAAGQDEAAAFGKPRVLAAVPLFRPA